jgi:hypothetical protein
MSVIARQVIAASLALVSLVGRVIDSGCEGRKKQEDKIPEPGGPRLTEAVEYRFKLAAPQLAGSAAGFAARWISASEILCAISSLNSPFLA